MATALDLETAALQEIGVLAAGQVPDAGQAADALSALNRMVNQWAAERLTIYSITRATWTITSGTYSVAGTATIPRPNKLDRVTYIDTSLSVADERPLEELTDAAYAAVRMKALTAVYPTWWYYSATYPSGTLILGPTPTSATLTGVIYAPQPVSSFPTVATAVSLPEGYEELIVTNLAVRLAPSYTRTVDQDLKDRAKEAKAIVKRANTRLADMSFPADALIGGGGGAYDIRTG